MIIKKILSFTASIINLFIFLIIFTFNLNAQENNDRNFSNDDGVLSIMYHRFNEFEYPSTNISMDIFKEHVDLILDANLTTLLTAFVLSFIGSGPIKGFATTLSIGIICSMFTAIFITKTIFLTTVYVMNLKKLSIGTNNSVLKIIDHKFINFEQQIKFLCTNYDKVKYKCNDQSHPFPALHSHFWFIY